MTFSSRNLLFKHLAAACVVSNYTAPAPQPQSEDVDKSDPVLRMIEDRLIDRTAWPADTAVFDDIRDAVGNGVVVFNYLWNDCMLLMIECTSSDASASLNIDTGLFSAGSPKNNPYTDTKLHRLAIRALRLCLQDDFQYYVDQVLLARVNAQSGVDKRT